MLKKDIFRTRILSVFKILWTMFSLEVLNNSILDILTNPKKINAWQGWEMYGHGGSLRSSITS
jgi:hypothetical protein